VTNLFVLALEATGIETSQKQFSARVATNLFVLNHIWNPSFLFGVKSDNTQTKSANHQWQEETLSKSTTDRVPSSTPTINVTPLIDVLLVLLIIFMVIQPHKEAKLPVMAPTEAPPGVPSSPEILMLSLSDTMQLELNSRSIDLSELIPLLKDLMEQRPVDTRTLYIKASSAITYGPVVNLIDLAKGAGVITVGLMKNEG